MDDIIQQVHSTVRQRWLNGDKFIISSMEEVANIALEGRTALLEKDYTKLASLMNRNFDLRRYNIDKQFQLECFHFLKIDHRCADSSSYFCTDKCSAMKYLGL